MTDYFEAPESDVETGGAPYVAGWILWLSLALVLIAALIFLVIQLATPSYDRLFAGFGAELPLATRIALAAGRFALVFVVLHALPLIRLWRSRRSSRARVRRDFGLVIAGFVLSLVAAMGWVASMYLPIYTMGATV